MGNVQVVSFHRFDTVGALRVLRPPPQIFVVNKALLCVTWLVLSHC